MQNVIHENDYQEKERKPTLIWGVTVWRDRARGLSLEITSSRSLIPVPCVCVKQQVNKYTVYLAHSYNNKRTTHTHAYVRLSSLSTAAPLRSPTPLLRCRAWEPCLVLTTAGLGSSWPNKSRLGNQLQNKERRSIISRHDICFRIKECTLIFFVLTFSFD